HVRGARHLDDVQLRRVLVLEYIARRVGQRIGQQQVLQLIFVDSQLGNTGNVLRMHHWHIHAQRGRRLGQHDCQRQRDTEHNQGNGTYIDVFVELRYLRGKTWHSIIQLAIDDDATAEGGRICQAPTC